jgi:hypothetical protein
MSECRSCGAEIVWVVTDSGKRIPVDAETATREIPNSNHGPGT